MSDQPKTGPSIWERSTIVRFFRWLFSWRGMRRVFLVLAWTATILALCYGEENWRGRRAWNHYRQAAEARGESFDYAAYIPKPVPDDRNFAATPFLQSFLLGNRPVTLTNDLYARAADHIIATRLAEGRRHFEDLVAWQLASTALQSGPLAPPGRKFQSDEADPAARVAAASVVLEGMKPDEAAFAELRAASTREFSRYPVKYELEKPWFTLIPHLAKIKQVCQRLSLQACAELAAGQTEQALADVRLTVALADSIKSEPFLVSILVRIACLHLAIQPVWEGLAEHRWSDAQLQELQARFLSSDFLADMQLSLKAERACGVLMVDLIKKQGLVILDGGSESGDPLRKVVFNGLGLVIPSGWYDLEKLNYCALYDAQMKGVVDLAAKTISPSTAESNANALTKAIELTQLIRQGAAGPSGWPFKALLRHRLIASTMPVLEGFVVKIAAAQITADQAALACALERYRLANGQFPEKLEALSPRFMPRQPNDVITGQPFKYRRADDGQFILYSVGWNEKDDGGVPGKSLFDKTEGDWVWSYPAK
jgi:hypothetical protein